MIINNTVMRQFGHNNRVVGLTPGICKRKCVGFCLAQKQVVAIKVWSCINGVVIWWGSTVLLLHIKSLVNLI